MLDENEDANLLAGAILADAEHGVDGIGGQGAHTADGGKHSAPEAGNEDVGGKAAGHGFQSGSGGQSGGNLNAGGIEHGGAGEENAQREHGEHTGEDQLVILDEAQSLGLVPALILHRVGIPQRRGAGRGAADDAGHHGGGAVGNRGNQNPEPARRHRGAQQRC